jgi:hypothetical protein
LQYVSWKTVCLFMVFPSKGIYRRKGDVRVWTRGPHHLVARPGGGPRHPMVRPPPGPVMRHGVDDIKHRPVGNPKRKV